MSLPESSLAQFLDELASASPAPGGGAAAAYAGALGAALVTMVLRLTIGRKNYQQVNDQFEALLPRADVLRTKLLGYMEEDTHAYSGVMDAYQLPKETDAERAVRNTAIQSALKHAAEVPLRVALLCAEVVELGEMAAAQGNKNAASDAGAGVLLAEAAMRAALLNVEINLTLIQDETVASNLRRAKDALFRMEGKRQSILQTVTSRL